MSLSDCPSGSIGSPASDGRASGPARPRPEGHAASRIIAPCRPPCPRRRKQEGGTTGRQDDGPDPDSGGNSSLRSSNDTSSGFSFLFHSQSPGAAGQLPSVQQALTGTGGSSLGVATHRSTQQLAQLASLPESGDQRPAVEQARAATPALKIADRQTMSRPDSLERPTIRGGTSKVQAMLARQSRVRLGVGG